MKKGVLVARLLGLIGKSSVIELLKHEWLQQPGEKKKKVHGVSPGLLSHSLGGYAALT